MDKKAEKFIQFLNDGMQNAKKQVEIELEIGLFRNEITKIVLSENLPIGSTWKGYFLIDNQEEYNLCIDTIDKRIKGLLKRKEAITKGWEKRKEYRRVRNLNYPKNEKLNVLE